MKLVLLKFLRRKHYIFDKLIPKPSITIVSIIQGLLRALSVNVNFTFVIFSIRDFQLVEIC